MLIMICDIEKYLNGPKLVIRYFCVISNIYYTQLHHVSILHRSGKILVKVFFLVCNQVLLSSNFG